MKTTKNTEKKSRKTTNKGKTVKAYPPIDPMDSWKVSSSFVEKKGLRYSLAYAVACMAIGFGSYWGYMHYTQKTSIVPPSDVANTPDIYLKNLNKPQQANQLVQLGKDYIRDNFDTAEENFIESQIGQEFSKRKDALFQDKAPTFQQKEAAYNIPTPLKHDIHQWLIKQHIQGVAYKDFESCLILNEKIFHLNDIVSPEYNLVWSDIDPVDKKLFFSDDSGNLYAINY